MALTTPQLLDMHRKMLTIRVFHRQAAAEYQAGNIPTPVFPFVGEEASSVGVCAALRQSDCVTSTHRSYGHAIAKGMDINAMMAELFGRANGCCHGKGGPMHLADFSVGMLGANGIVGGGLPIAAGAALAAQMEGQGGVAVAFFGDGASNEGTFHSALNLAAIWKLPVIFVCENNGWAIAVPASYALSVQDVSVRAISYDIPGVTVDGTDALAVHEAAEQAVARARAGRGPTLIECKTYRYNAQTGQTAGSNLPPAPEAAVRGNLRDPVAYFAERLLELGAAAPAQLKQMEQEVEEAVAQAVAFAEASPLPRPEDALTEVFAA